MTSDRAIPQRVLLVLLTPLACCPPSVLAAGEGGYRPPDYSGAAYGRIPEGAPANQGLDYAGPGYSGPGNGLSAGLPQSSGYANPGGGYGAPGGYSRPDAAPGGYDGGVPGGYGSLARPGGAGQGQPNQGYGYGYGYGYGAPAAFDAPFGASAARDQGQGSGGATGGQRGGGSGPAVGFDQEAYIQGQTGERDPRHRTRERRGRRPGSGGMPDNGTTPWGDRR